jgi:class 3 adenylate cyclase
MVDLPTGTVTFLFTDVEGSTRLLGQLGEDEYGAVLEEHRSRLREAFAAGREVDTQGDSLFYAFARADDAVVAAIAGQRALDDLPVLVRMGLHTGQPVIVGDRYVGLDVHRAARICAPPRTAARCCFLSRRASSWKPRDAISESSASRI